MALFATVWWKQHSLRHDMKWSKASPFFEIELTIDNKALWWIPWILFSCGIELSLDGPFSILWWHKLPLWCIVYRAWNQPSFVPFSVYFCIWVLYTSLNQDAAHVEFYCHEMLFFGEIWAIPFLADRMFCLMLSGSLLSAKIMIYSPWLLGLDQMLEEIERKVPMWFFACLKAIPLQHYISYLASGKNPISLKQQMQEINPVVH